MGAGRLHADQAVDPAVGIELAACYGERVDRGQPLAYLHVRSKRDIEKLVKRVRAAFGFSRTRPARRKLVLGRVE